MKINNVKKERAIEELASGIAPGTVAKHVGVTPETVSHWQREPDFIGAVKARAAELRANIQSEVEGAGPKALRYLESVVDNEGESTFQRISAARTILQYHSGLRSNTAPAAVSVDIDEGKIEAILEGLKCTKSE